MMDKNADGIVTLGEAKAQLKQWRAMAIEKDLAEELMDLLAKAAKLNGDANEATISDFVQVKKAELEAE